MAVESGAGEGAGHPDAEYSEAGASVGSGDDAWGAEVVVKVAVPTLDEIGRLRSGQVLIGHLAPLTSGETNRALADAGVTSFAMEAIPRITRAQAMDALSSQANVAGYAATLLAAREAGRFFPMMTTAAGTVAPAKVMVLGRRRRRPAGDRDREAARRGGHRVRHPPRRLGADREPRRPSAGARLHPRRRGRGRLRAPADRRGERAGARGPGRGGRAPGRDHHHGPGARPPGAAPDHRRGRARHAAGLGDRRPGRRVRRATAS